VALNTLNSRNLEQLALKGLSLEVVKTKKYKRFWPPILFEMVDPDFSTAVCYDDLYYCPPFGKVWLSSGLHISLHLRSVAMKWNAVLFTQSG